MLVLGSTRLGACRELVLGLWIQGLETLAPRTLTSPAAAAPIHMVDVTVMVRRLQTTFSFSVGLHFEVGKVGSIWSGMVRRVYIWLTIGFC